MGNNYKIVFTGPVGAGKSTAINSISDIETVVTDEVASDMTQSMKEKTTVAMDYGMLRLQENEKVHLYGTPGQERFDFMWDILIQGSIGLILLLDNTRNSPYQDMKFFTSVFRNFIEENGMVVGVTRMDEARQPNLSQYQSWLDELYLSAPVFEVDARQKGDVSTLVEALLYSQDPGIEATCQAMN